MVRRRAWINSSRHWSTLEEEEGPLCNVPSTSTADDDVFSDGCFTGKIEDWLLGCGPDSSTETSTQLNFESVRQANSCTDDLSLGADASVVNRGETTSKPCLRQHPSSEQHRRFPSSSFHRGLCPPSHSMTSSCLSSSTWKSTSSVLDVLDLCSEDAEETLFDLGFGCDVPQVTVRIPPRFFTFPSQARGINLRLFLDSQLRRIREEDPNLSLASRFRQVEVLTAMANAFYSLYSHVSRTPLQKLATPEFSFSSCPVERLERFRSSVRSEPRSPVERLKDTVNKMCLYPGSPRGSDSSSPQHSPRRRSSFPDIADGVLKNKTGPAKKLDFEEHNQDSRGDVKLIAGSGEAKQSDDIQNRNEAQDKAVVIKDAGENCIQQTEFYSRAARASPLSTLSRGSMTETEQEFLSDHPESDSHSAAQDTNPATLEPVKKATTDLDCLPITERAHHSCFCCQKAQSLPRVPSEAESKSKSLPHKPQTQTAISDGCCPQDTNSAEELIQAEGFRSSVLENNCRAIQCSIIVTGWEGNDVSCSLNAASNDSSLQMSQESFHQNERQYLAPHHDLGRLTASLQQVNSFELEEVHSGGEEDFGLSLTTRATSSPMSKHYQHKGEVVRGDSMQSDSSGYADEEVGLQLDRHST